MTERMNLSMEDFENVNGGYVFNNGESVNPWEVIDWSGNVLERWPSKERAQGRAYALGQDTMELSWKGLQNIRSW